MPARHAALAVLVAALWGVNFLAINASLLQFPPFLLVALRFAVIAIPTLIFVPKPAVKWRWILGYGVGFGMLQFLFLYWGMQAGMPAGLASLVLQTSAPFTVILGATLLREKLSGRQVIGILIAVAGLCLIGWHRWQLASILPFLLTVAGAAGWALGNICNRQAHTTEPMRLTLWMSVVPPIPMLVLSLLVEGTSSIGRAFTTLGTPTGVWSLVGLAYTVVFGTLVGSGIWTWLMARHPASRVSPFSLLVPVVGMSTAWLVLGEQIAAPEALGGIAIVGGVLIGVLPALPGLRRRRVVDLLPAKATKPMTRLEGLAARGAEGAHGRLENSNVAAASGAATTVARHRETSSGERSETAPRV